MTYRLEIDIPRLPTMPNVGVTRQHWSVRMRERKMWEQEVMAAVTGRRPPEPLEHVHVHCLRRSSASRKPDDANLRASFKPVIDALVSQRIFVDDNPTVMSDEYDTAKAPPRKGSIRVRVTEIVR